MTDAGTPSFWDAATQNVGGPLTLEIWIQFLIDLNWRWHMEAHPRLFPEVRPFVVLPPALARAHVAVTTRHPVDPPD